MRVSSAFTITGPVPTAPASGLPGTETMAFATLAHQLAASTGWVSDWFGPLIDSLSPGSDGTTTTTDAGRPGGEATRAGMPAEATDPSADLPPRPSTTTSSTHPCDGRQPPPRCP